MKIITATVWLVFGWSCASPQEAKHLPRSKRHERLCFNGGNQKENCLLVVENTGALLLGAVEGYEVLVSSLSPGLGCDAGGVASRGGREARAAGEQGALVQQWSLSPDGF